MRLDIQLGANADGLKSVAADVETITKRIEGRFAATVDQTLRMSSNIARVSTTIGDMGNNVGAALKKVDFSTISAGNQKLVTTISNTVSTVTTLADVTTTASAAWGTMTTVASAGLTRLATAVPRLAGTIGALAGPIGAVVAIAVAGAVAIGANWYNASNKMSAVDKVMQEATTSAAAQQAQVKVLTDKVKNLSLGYVERNRALSDLKKINNDIFGQFSIEKGNLDKLGTAVENYNTKLLNTIKIRAIEAAVLQKQQQIIENENKIKTAPEATKTTGLFALYQRNFVDTKQSISTDIGTLNKEIQELLTAATKVGPVLSDSKAPKVTTTAKGDSDFVKLKKELAGIDTLVEAGLLNPIAAATRKMKELDQASEKFATAGIKKGAKEFQFVNAELDKASKGLADLTRSAASVPALGLVPVASVAAVVDRAQQIADGTTITLPTDLKAIDTKKIANVTTQIASAVTAATDSISTIVQNGYAQRDAIIDASYAKERKAIEASLLPASIKEKRLQQLEEQTAIRRKKAAREQAVAAKKGAIFNAIINTAAGVARALAYEGVVGAVIAGALGALQIAAIASTPLPQLAKGAIVYGNSIVNVGEYAGAKNNPEVIAPLDKLSAILRGEIRSAIPQQANIVDIGGGRGPASIDLRTEISSDSLYILGQYQEYKSSRVRV